MIFSSESGSLTLPSVPEQRQALGAFRLAAVLLERIGAATNIHDACRFLIELLPLFLDADAVSIELPTCIAAESYRWPESFFTAKRGSALPRASALEVNTQLLVDDMPRGWCRLYYTHPSAEASDYGKGVLDFIGVCLAHHLADALSAKTLFSTLSPTEHRVLALLDLTNEEILDRLGIGYETFRTHSKRIYKKFGVNSRQEAIALARKAGGVYGDRAGR